jgi:hypothetical protein
MTVGENTLQVAPSSVDWLPLSVSVDVAPTVMSAVGTKPKLSTRPS